LDGVPGNPSPAEGEWRPIDAIPWSALSGDSAPGGGGGREMEPTPSPESGPISPIAFEIDKSQEK